MLPSSVPLHAEAAQDQALLALRAVLGEQACCIFIDPTLHDPLEADAPLTDAYRSLHALGKVVKRRLPHIHDNFDPARQPYVLYLSNQFDTERLLHASLRLACDEATAQSTPNARTVCGWLRTNQPAQDVANWLGSRAKLVRPDNQAWYLRFWDPRVVWHLPRVLDPAHLAWLRPGLAAWHYVDDGLQLRCALAPNTQRGGEPVQLEASLDEPPAATQRLDVSTWSRLQRIEAVNRVYAAFADAPLQANDEIARRIEHFLERSALVAFAGIDDAVTFACAALVSHPRFDEHPAVAGALAASPSVAAALGGFDDMFWAQLREGSWLTQLPSIASTP